MDKEEGEMSDDNSMMVDVEQENTKIVSPSNCTLTYKADKNGLIIQELEKVDACKLEERAKRFGLNISGKRVVTQSQIDELYNNCGIEIENKRHYRFDSLHLSGIDGLSTREIFEYLEDYKPVALEWIDNNSCNVVCQDHITAALALLVHSREIKNEDLKNILKEKSSHHWREGMPHPKKDLILIRFATNGDKKVSKKKPEPKHWEEYSDQNLESISKNPWGDLCKSWGVYDHQEVFNRRNDYHESDDEPGEKIIKIKNKRLAMRLGKRTHNYEDSDDSDSEWKKKSKAPRMRMHADDEESRQKRNLNLDIVKTEPKDRDAYAPLSIEVVNQKSSFTPRETGLLSQKFKCHNKKNVSVPREGIQSRLGEKVVPEEDFESSDEQSSDNSQHLMSRVQKVSSNTGSVWSRLESKSVSPQKDLRNILKSRKDKQSNDLRDRIRRSKQSNLRIEIDNN